MVVQPLPSLCMSDGDFYGFVSLAGIDSCVTPPLETLHTRTECRGVIQASVSDVVKPEQRSLLRKDFCCLQDAAHVFFLKTCLYSSHGGENDPAFHF